MTETFRIFVDAGTARAVREALAEVEREAGAILSEAALEGAELIRAEAERRAPKLSGEGAASIAIAEKKIGPGRAEIVIGPDVDKPKPRRGGTKHFYMLMHEFGADRHPIKPKNRKALAIDGAVVARADHPGVPARPFMRPALDEKADEAIERIGDALRRKLGI